MAIWHPRPVSADQLFDQVELLMATGDPLVVDMDHRDIPDDVTQQVEQFTSVIDRYHRSYEAGRLALEGAAESDVDITVGFQYQRLSSHGKTFQLIEYNHGSITGNQFAFYDTGEYDAYPNLPTVSFIRTTQGPSSTNTAMGLLRPKAELFSADERRELYQTVIAERRFLNKQRSKRHQD